MIDGEASLPSRQARRVLLVEGQNDKHVVEHVYWKRFESKPPFDVLDKEGFSRLSESIGPELKAPEREVVGVIVDANDDLTARWTAIADRLRNACPGIEIGVPVPDGTIAGSEPRVGIWLWPDNESGGELEDFVARMIPGDDPVWPLSRCYIQGIPAGTPTVLRRKDGTRRDPCLARDERRAEADGSRNPHGRSEGRWSARYAIRKLAREPVRRRGLSRSCELGAVPDHRREPVPPALGSPCPPGRRTSRLRVTGGNPARFEESRALVPERQYVQLIHAMPFRSRASTQSAPRLRPGHGRGL